MSERNDEFTYRDGITLREYIDVKFSSHDSALKISEKEYERRLDFLNGEAERLKHMQSTYLPREIYETKHDLTTTKIEALEKLVYVGLGIILALQFIIHFLK
jgi:hypothetical protein